MGYTSASDMLNQTEDLHTSIAWHLRANIYPPVPLSMVEPCYDAVLAILDNEPERGIALPEGVFYRGEDIAPAWAVVEGHRLEAFIDSMMEE